jgi:predicted transcriptional regulator
MVWTCFSLAKGAGKKAGQYTHFAGVSTIPSGFIGRNECTVPPFCRRYNEVVTVKDELHLLIDRLADEQARELLADLRDAADADGPPLDPEALASLDRGLADIASGRTITLEDFEREHPL